MTDLGFAMVTTFYPPESFGGDGIFVQRLSRALVERGHRVTVVACSDAYRASGGRGALAADATSVEDGVRVVRLRSPLGGLSPLATHATGRPWLKRAALERALREAGDGALPDVVHFHNASLVGGPGAFALARGAVRLYTMHEHWLVCPTHVFWKNRSRLCDRRTCFRCQLRSGRPPQLWRSSRWFDERIDEVDLFLAPSAFTRDKHREVWSARGVAPHVEVLPHFVPEAGDRGPAPRDETPRFLYAGRLDPVKGPADLLDAVAATGNELDVEVRIAGDGPERQSLEARASASGRAVRFLGFLPPADLDRELAGARAVVVPTRCFETFGLTVAEALMRGVPVIARRRGALAELVTESGGGLLFDDGRELAAQLATLAGDPDLASRLGAAGRAHALGAWTLDAHLEAYLGHVERLLT